MAGGLGVVYGAMRAAVGLRPVRCVTREAARYIPPEMRTERLMSSKLKAFGLLGLIVLAAACAREEEVVIVSDPVVEEPVSNKY